MRAMLAAVIVMGILIVLGVATLAVTVVQRLSAPPPTLAATLDEPPGTQMKALVATGDRLALLLQGGGPDRVVMLDPRSNRVVGRLSLAH